MLPQANDDGVLAKDHFGRLFVFGADDELGSQQHQLLRLRRNGVVDRRFGEGGSITLSDEDWGTSWTLAVDDRSRPILAYKGAGKQQKLVLERRWRDGEIDHRFGNGGRTATGFPGRIEPRQVLVGGSGKILVAGTFYAGNRFGVGLARYLAG